MDIFYGIVCYNFDTMFRRALTYLFRIVVLFAAYFFTAKLGLALAYSSQQITLVWPPAGIALAAALLWGFSMWPGIFLGAFFANFSIGGVFLSSLGIAVGNTLAALVGAFLLRRIKGFNQSFARVSDYLWFVIFGAAASTLISASIGVSSLALSHAISIASAKDFFSFFRLWWVGDATGILFFAPVFLVLPYTFGNELYKKRLPEALALFSACAFAGFFVFSPATHYFVVLFLPLVLWASVRFYQPGVIGMSLFLLAVANFATIHDFGLFANIGSVEENLLFSQIFLSLLLIGSMVVALTTFEKEKAVREWKRLSLSLHERIAEQSEKLAAHAESLQEYIDHMSIFTAKLSPDGSILALSKLSEKASGLSHDELLKTNFLDGQWFAFDQEVSSRVRGAFRRAVAGETVRYDERILVFGTMVIWISFGLVPILDADGKTISLIAEGLDITKRKELESALAKSHSELEKKVAERTAELHDANAALTEEIALRDQFLATLSHELRNPLSPIVSATEIIRMMNIQDEEIRQPFEIIERQANQMARLLKDLLDVSRISHQKIDLEIGQVHLENVMKAAVETARPLMEKCKHRLSVFFPEKDIVIQGDALRIEQIIVNLLNNAAKYTPEAGQISLSGRMDGGKAVITVKDNGIGISAEMMPKIFNLFSQDKKNSGMAKGGLGIGLALAKALTELHGGEIRVSSEGTGKGAIFEIILPLKQQENDAR